MELPSSPLYCPSIQGHQMLVQKCHLLINQGQLDDVVTVAKQLLFHEWRLLEAAKSGYLGSF